MALAVPVAATILPEAELHPSEWLGSAPAVIERRRALAAHILTSSQTTALGELFPLLQTNRVIPYHHKDVRVRNCFRLYGKIKLWNDFCSYTVKRLLQVDGAGDVAVGGFLEAAIRESAQVLLEQDRYDDIRNDQIGRPDKLVEATEDSADAASSIDNVQDSKSRKTVHSSGLDEYSIVHGQTPAIRDGQQVDCSKESDRASSEDCGGSADDESLGMLGLTGLAPDVGPYIEIIEKWAVTRRDAKKFGDVFQLSPTVGELVPSLQNLWATLSSSSLPIDEELTFEPVRCAWRILESLNDRERQILYWRVLAIPNLTLEQTGSRLKLTRERVRQLEKALDEQVRQQVNSAACRPLRWMLDDLCEVLGAAFREEWLEDIDDLRQIEGYVRMQSDHILNRARRPHDPNDEIPTIGLEDLTEFLLWLAGPYSYIDGWLVNEKRMFSRLNQMLLEGAKQSLGLPLERALELLQAAGLTTRAGLDYLAQTEIPKLRRVNDVLYPWSGTVGDKAEVMLAILGRPASDAELVELIGEGHKRRSLRNRLFEEQRFMRVDLDLFALRSWGLEEYSGISEEIAERIERAGGEAILEDVVDELLATFSISESSIRQYAATPRFVREDGRIRLREHERIEVEEEDPLGVLGVYRPSPYRLRWAIPVNAEIIRGSGRGIPVALAVALGALPGEEQPYDWDDGIQLRVLWRLDSPSGPEIGSVAFLMAPTAATAGDLLMLDFDVENRQVSAERIAQGVDLEQRIIALTGIHGVADPLERLGRALEVDPNSVRAVLRRRRDFELLALLPTPDESDQLRSALDDLTIFLARRDDS